MGNLFFSIRGFAAHREKSNPYFSSDEDFLSPFIRKKTAFSSGTPNFFGPSYFEAALGGLIFYLKKCPGDKNNSSSFWLILIGGNDISEKIKPRKLLGLIKNFMKQIVDVRSLHVVFGSLIPKPGIFRIFPSLEKLTIHITIPPLHHATTRRHDATAPLCLVFSGCPI